MRRRGDRVEILFNALRVGGSQTYFLQLSSELLKHHYSIRIIAKPGPLTNEFLRAGATVSYIRWQEGTAQTRKTLRFFLIKLVSIFYLLRLQWRWRLSPPDLVICSQPWPLKYAAELLPRDVPIVALFHGFTEVEFPPKHQDKTLQRINYLFAVSEETALKLQPHCSKQINVLGNFLMEKLSGV